MKNHYKLLKPGVTSVFLLFFVLLLCTFQNAQSQEEVIVAAAPPYATYSVCEPGGTVTLTVTCGGAVQWYQTKFSDVVLHTGSTYTTTVSASTSFWFTCAPGNDRSEVVVTVNPKPVPTISTDSPVCVGTLLRLTGGPAGMTTYAWTGPDGFSASTQNYTITNVTTAKAGTYTLTVTDANGCIGTTSATVVVNTTTTPTVSSNSPVCAGATLNLTGGPAGMSYAWSGPNGFTSALQNPSITNVTTAASGTYTMTVSNTSGCTGTSTTSVVVNALPVCSIEGPAAICAGSSGVFTAAPASSYAWTGPGTFSGSTRSVTVTTAGTYTVTITDGNGCQSTCSKALTVNPLPTCSIDGPAAICAGTSTVYTATAGMSAYAWTGPGTFSGSTRSITVTTAGTYTVTITDGNGCKSTCSKGLTVNPKPTCSVSPTTAKICSGFTQTFSVIPAGGTGPYTVAWIGPGFTSTSTTITVGVGGTYTATVTDSKGCVSAGCTGVLTVEICGYCSYTQGFFGNQKGKACDLTATPKPGAAFTAALLAEGNLVIGTPTKNITFTAEDAPLIQAILPGGGGSYLLSGTCSPTWDPENVDFGCLDPYLKDRQHRLNNTLLSQTITLGLNLRIGDNKLGTIPLQSGKWLVTQDKESCVEGSGYVDPVCSPVYSTETPTLITCYNLTTDPYHYENLDADVISYMTNKGYALTVQGLFKLANDALGGLVTSTITLSDIASTVDLINNAFDECRGFIGYWTDKYACANACQAGKSAIIPVDQPGSLSVYPNPFNEKLTFEFVSGKDAFATLEIYNMMGQKVRILMSRQVEQGAMYKVDFQPTDLVPGVLIYRLILDNDVQTGKVIYNK